MISEEHPSQPHRWLVDQCRSAPSTVWSFKHKRWPGRASNVQHNMSRKLQPGVQVRSRSQPWIKTVVANCCTACLENVLFRQTEIDSIDSVSPRMWCVLQRIECTREQYSQIKRKCIRNHIHVKMNDLWKTRQRLFNWL